MGREKSCKNGMLYTNARRRIVYKGKKNPNWKGGQSVNSYGYIFLWCPNHPHKNKDNQVAKHRLIVEEVLGRHLKPNECVHHSNERVRDNRRRNLVACEDNTYHMLLHKRMRAYKACGHVDWMLCRYCSQYDNPENMHVGENGKYAEHRSCNAAFQAAYRKGISYKEFKKDFCSE